MERRNFIQLSAIAGGAGILAGLAGCAAKENEKPQQKKMTDHIVPISLKERKDRIEKAQRLLAFNQMDALLLDAGTSMFYYTGLSWWPGERPMMAVIPAEGEVSYICPAFEMDRLRELIIIGNEVRGWEEDESPFKLMADLFKSSRKSGNIAIEERLRFFILDELKKEAPQLQYVSGNPVTVPCRMVKSSAEIALMKKANDITTKAIKAGIASLKEGVSHGEVSEVIRAAHENLGAEPSFASVNFGEATALPHGSIKPQQLKKGDVVLMDCGCSVEGYCSDITRTLVFGEPTKRQLEVWNTEKKAQAAGFAAAKNNVPCGSVDAAARKVLSDAGFGPGYKLPGLPHRTGHGIGLDVHEWHYMVKDNPQLLQPGLCFSVEPTIAIPGEFGVRLEDCVYMTEEGPNWFTQPAASIDQPFSDEN